MQVKLFEYHTDEYRKSLQLRHAVLRKPLNLEFTEEELRKDAFDRHLGIFEGNELVASLILSDSANQRLKIRQVAVNSKCQQMGYGSLLSKSAEQIAVDEGYKIVFCHARKTAVPFYLKLGYEVVSSEFIEVGIPHYIMEKQV